MVHVKEWALFFDQNHEKTKEENENFIVLRLTSPNFNSFQQFSCLAYFFRVLR